MGAWLRQGDLGTQRGVGLWFLIGTSVLLAVLVPPLLLALLPVLTFALFLGSTPWESTVAIEPLGTLQLPQPSPRGPPKR